MKEESLGVGPVLGHREDSPTPVALEPLSQALTAEAVPIGVEEVTPAELIDAVGAAGGVGEVAARRDVGLSEAGRSQAARRRRYLVGPGSGVGGITHGLQVVDAPLPLLVAGVCRQMSQRHQCQEQ